MTRSTKPHHASTKPRPERIEGWGLPLYWAGTPQRHPWDEDRNKGRGTGPYRQRARSDRDE